MVGQTKRDRRWLRETEKDRQTETGVSWRRCRRAKREREREREIKFWRGRQKETERGRQRTARGLRVVKVCFKFSA